MGCCFSRPDGPNSPSPGGGSSAGEASARIVDAQSPAAGAAAVASAAPRDAAASGAAASGANPPDDFSSLPTNASHPQTSHHRHHLLQHHPHGGAQPQAALSQHINKPLRRRRWTSRNRVWTRHAIDRERVDFFDTRVTGRPEIWQALHAALTILWEADLAAAAKRDEFAAHKAQPVGGGVGVSTGAAAANSKEEEKALEAVLAMDATEARITAQTMLEAADITLPTGNPVQGAYDTLGNFYALPAWIVSDPTNLNTDPTHLDDKGLADLDESGSILSEDDEVDGDDDDDDDDDDGGDGNGHGQTDQHRQRDLDDEGDEVNLCGSVGDTTSRRRRSSRPSLRRRREEKGKAVATVTQHPMTVRARLSATERDVVVHLGREDTVRSLAHRVAEEANLPHKTRIRIAYLGKILKDSQPLMAQGWKEGDVVNALMFEGV